MRANIRLSFETSAGKFHFSIPALHIYPSRLRGSFILTACTRVSLCHPPPTAKGHETKKCTGLPAKDTFGSKKKTCRRKEKFILALKIIIRSLKIIIASLKIYIFKAKINFSFRRNNFSRPAGIFFLTTVGDFPGQDGKLRGKGAICRLMKTDIPLL